MVTGTRLVQLLQGTKGVHCHCFCLATIRGLSGGIGSCVPVPSANSLTPDGTSRRHRIFNASSTFPQLGVLLLGELQKDSASSHLNPLTHCQPGVLVSESSAALLRH